MIVHETYTNDRCPSFADAGPDGKVWAFAAPVYFQGWMHKDDASPRWMALPWDSVCVNLVLSWLPGYLPKPMESR